MTKNNQNVCFRETRELNLVDICREKQACGASDSRRRAQGGGGRGWSFIIFGSRKGWRACVWEGGGGSYKLSVGGINGTLLVRMGGARGAGSMLVGVTVCSHCLPTATVGRG